MIDTVSTGTGKIVYVLGAGVSGAATTQPPIIADDPPSPRGRL